MKIIFLFSLIFSSLAAQAQIQFGLAAGFRSGQAETNIQGATIPSETGMQFGAISYFPIQAPFGVRSGFLYTQRYSTIERTLSGTVDVDFAYFDVPLQGRMQFSDFGGVFAGPVLAFNQSKEVTCSNRANCAALDVRSFLLPLQLGLDFRFLPQVGGELYFEYVAGDLATSVSNMKTVGANVLFFFE